MDSLKLEDEVSGNLLLLQMRCQGACCCCGLCQTPGALSCDWENHGDILLLSKKSCCEEGFMSQVSSPHAVLGLSHSHIFLCHQAGI